MGAPPTSTIRIIRPFFEAERKLGYGPSVQWQQTGFSVQGPEDLDRRIPHVVLHQLLEAAIERTGRQDLGLLAAEEVRAGDLDLFELATRSTSTLGDALSCAQRLIPLLDDGWELTLSEQEGLVEARFSLRPGVQMPRAGFDFLLGVAVTSMRRVTGQDVLHMLQVCFPYPAPDDLSAHQRIIQGTLRFEQPYAALRFSNEALLLPMLHASATVNVALEQVAAELLASGYGRDDLRARVAHAIGGQLSSGHLCTASSVAKELGMNVRTLQRRLDEEGTGFRAVLDEHRARLARAYVGRPDLPMAEVAYLLGFSSPSAFHRAFKRWTGLAPAAARKAALRGK